jgi:hypothetical protein
LAYLAVTATPHTCDALATLFWPKADQERARGALRYTLTQLRSAIGEEWLHTSREQIALALHPNLTIDVAQVDHLYAQVQEHGHPVGYPCAECVADLQAIVALMQGLQAHRGRAPHATPSAAALGPPAQVLPVLPRRCSDANTNWPRLTIFSMTPLAGC